MAAVAQPGRRRWGCAELNPPLDEATGREARTKSPALAARPTPIGAGGHAALSDAYNTAPRVGVAWQIHTRPGWETVRGGAGIHYDVGSGSWSRGFWLSVRAEHGGAEQRGISAAGGALDYIPECGSRRTPRACACRLFDPDFRSPKDEHGWNAAVESRRWARASG